MTEDERQILVTCLAVFTAMMFYVGATATFKMNTIQRLRRDNQRLRRLGIRPVRTRTWLSMGGLLPFGYWEYRKETNDD